MNNAIYTGECYCGWCSISRYCRGEDLLTKIDCMLLMHTPHASCMYGRVEVEPRKKSTMSTCTYTANGGVLLAPGRIAGGGGAERVLKPSVPFGGSLPKSLFLHTTTSPWSFTLIPQCTQIRQSTAIAGWSCQALVR